MERKTYVIVEVTSTAADSLGELVDVEAVKDRVGAGATGTASWWVAGHTQQDPLHAAAAA